jgi:hypothetical protein
VKNSHFLRNEQQQSLNPVIFVGGGTAIPGFSGSRAAVIPSVGVPGISSIGPTAIPSVGVPGLSSIGPTAIPSVGIPGISSIGPTAIPSVGVPHTSVVITGLPHGGFSSPYGFGSPIFLGSGIPGYFGFGHLHGHPWFGGLPFPTFW